MRYNNFNKINKKTHRKPKKVFSKNFFRKNPLFELLKVSFW